jgi:hypothetical protein
MPLKKYYRSYAVFCCCSAHQYSRITLVGFNNDCVGTSSAVAEVSFKNTSHSNRWEILKLLSFTAIRIVVSGGFDLERIARFEPLGFLLTSVE